MSFEVEVVPAMPNYAGKSKKLSEDSKARILDDYIQSHHLSGLCYMPSKNGEEISFTGFGKEFNADITYVNNKSHLKQLLTKNKYDFVVLDVTSGLDEHETSFGFLCDLAAHHVIKGGLLVSMIRETDEEHFRPYQEMAQAHGFKVVAGKKKGSTIDTRLHEFLSKN